MRRAARVPFAERGGKLRGLLDLATGRYPRFLFGAPVGRLLPVFHFHQVRPADLEPQLRYLAENAYQTVTADAISRLVRDGQHPGRFSVALCFDDARASLWTVAQPLLRKYGFRGITFAIPGRISEAVAPRPTIEEDMAAAEDADRSATPFVTWPELEALHRSGLIDVQSHTVSHSSIFCGDEPTGFVTPGFNATDLLDRPLVARRGESSYLTPDDLGAPLYVQRSRMSDARRFFDDEEVRARCLALAQAEGGSAFFETAGWEQRLRAIAQQRRGSYESPEARVGVICDELDRSRAILADRLRTSTIRHLCFPWGVAGSLARDTAQKVAYETAFSERLFGLRAVRAGDDPYRLMRLNGKFVTWLPRKRRLFVAFGGSRPEPGSPRNHAR